MQVLRLKVPPVAVVFATAALMWLSSRAVPSAELAIPARKFVALCLAIGGAVTSISGVVSFRRAGTTVNPLTPGAASSLVRSGIYKLSRNPMYLGFLMALLGWAFYLSNALAFVLVPVFFGYMNRFQIDPEEDALASRFGQEFASYAARVRRWI